MASIFLDNVSVSFPVYSHSSQSLKNKVLSSLAGSPIKQRQGITYIDALKNLNLKLNAGHRLALVGHNGAGKSTLLRVIAGIYPPTAGQVITHGKIQALFDRNLGISLDASGWDNIETRGILLGLNDEAIEKLKLDVLEISGLGAYLDIPIRTYSTGMIMRLTFSIITCMKPDILLLDESVIAGDRKFIELARKKIDAMIGQAQILVLASHSIHLLREFCNCGLLLNKGEAIYFDDLEELISAYYKP